MDPFGFGFFGPFIPMDPADQDFFYYAEWSLAFMEGGGDSSPAKAVVSKNFKEDKYSINVSSYERNTECSLIREKVTVWDPKTESSEPLAKNLIPGNQGDRFISYEKAEGKTFRFPDCPCSVESTATWPAITIKSRSDFKELRNYFDHVGYMEQSVCWRFGNHQDSPPPPTQEEPPHNSPVELVASIRSPFDDPPEDADCYAFDEATGWDCENVEEPVQLASLFGDFLQNSVESIVSVGGDLLAGGGAHFLSNIASKIGEMGLQNSQGDQEIILETPPSEPAAPSEDPSEENINDDSWSPSEEEEYSPEDDDYPT